MRPTTAPHLAIRLLPFLLALSAPANASAWELATQFQESSGPSKIKQLWFPEFQSQTGMSAREIAWDYLSTHAEELSIDSILSKLALMDERQSLLGTHLRYQQMQGKVPVLDASIIVSVLKDGRIYQIYNTTQSIPKTLLDEAPNINQEQAFDIAWKHLGVSGSIFEEPKASVVYAALDGKLRLVYQIELSTLAPYGAWRLTIDARNGAVLQTKDVRINHRPWAIDPEISAKKGPLIDRKTAFANWQKRQDRPESSPMALRPGLAQVFDPDPRTTLYDRSIEDESPLDVFEEAYFKRELPEVSFDGNKFLLDGPWVRIIDFDPPRTAPAQSKNGQWIYPRGQSGFNDAMTYYHLDKNQRYIQSLGFKGDTGIQFGPIEADADGVNGDDNSYFQPSSNRLSFGKGCVDDNEDTDVILHEYGHAIHFSINPNWYGGDTGAMGEGFGDYWAASYSYSIDNGRQFFPEEIYTWDGHGNNDSCWPGRVLDALDARYDHSRNYPAHSPIPGDFQSDELWSTPLFQSHMRLRAMGIPREEIDTIVLQAQFGLGASLKMRDMAQSILATASILYPTGPHASVFKENFIRHGILEDPHPVLSIDLQSVTDSEHDGTIDPGETLDLKLFIRNQGTLAASNAKISLSSNEPLIEIIAGNASYGDIAIGAARANTSPLTLHVNPITACGYLIQLNVNLAYGDGEEANFPIAIRVGKPIGFQINTNKNMAIPDDNDTGITSSLDVAKTGQVTDQLRVKVQIKHSYRADLRVVLRSPQGKTLVLHDRTGFAENDLRGVYPLTLQPKESLSRLIGSDRSGRWSLIVQDLAMSDTGALESWGLEDVSHYECH